MTNTNIAKQYAIYFRFNSLLKEKKQLFRLRTINITEIQEAVGEEFGLSSKSVRMAVSYITKNMTSPYVQKEKLLFEENRTNYFAIYNSDEDIDNIDLIEKSIKKTKSTKTAFIFYFIYKRYQEVAVEEKIKKGVYDRPAREKAYDRLADEFYYTNIHSIRNIVNQVKSILNPPPPSF